MRARLLWVAAVVLGVSLHAETLTVATYNVENYVATDRMTEGGYRKDYPKPETQKTALRKVIRGVNADVLILQEMGGAGYVEELQRDLASDGASYPHAVLLEAADPDRHLVVLSRRALGAVVRHASLEFDYFKSREQVKRGVIEVKLPTSAGDLIIFGVHLKSRFTDRPDDPLSSLRRLGEATAVRDLLAGRVTAPEAAMVLILGDFNDDKKSKTLERILRRGKKPLLKLLPAADSRGETWTHAYRKEDSYSRVDHILVSPALEPMVVHAVATIYDGSGVLEASDHRPVVVTLDFTAKK